MNRQLFEIPAFFQHVLHMLILVVWVDAKVMAAKYVVSFETQIYSVLVVQLALRGFWLLGPGSQ